MGSEQARYYPHGHKRGRTGRPSGVTATVKPAVRVHLWMQLAQGGELEWGMGGTASASTGEDASYRTSTEKPEPRRSTARGCRMKALERRLARLERASDKSALSYVVRVVADRIDDDATITKAIAEHRRQTGCTAPIVLIPCRMALEAWVARFAPTGSKD